tara:strand:+ start:3052 stop:4854 length:1803 start_codon:yes stop_codon:yes gene_type:complete
MYLLQVSILYFFIITFSIVLNIYFKVKFQKTFLISISFLCLLIYILFKIGFFLYLDYLIFILIALNFLILLTVIKKIKINNFLIFYTFIYFIVSFFCYEKYLLDHDEFSYWGKYTKTFFAYDNYGFYFNNYLNTQDILIKLKPETLRVHFDLAVQAKYHEPIIPLFQHTIMKLSGFREDLAIFTNNTILISSIMYVLKDNFFEKKLNLFFPIIFYAFLNIFSFGFVSIYMDPIICSLFFISLIISYENFSKNKFNLRSLAELTLILIILSLIHRSGIIYVYYIIFFIGYLKLTFYLPKYYLIPISILFISIPIFYELYNINNSFITDFIKISNSYLYFSEVGSIFKFIFKYLGLNNLNNFSYKIYIYTWIILLSFLYIFSNQYKILLFFLLIFFVHSFIILIVKYYGLIPLHFLNNKSLITDNTLHKQHLPRYFSPIFFSMLLFFIYCNYKLLKIKFFSIITLIIILILPLKAIGFFLPKQIYHMKDDNLEFYNLREQITTETSKFIKNYDYYTYKNNLLLATKEKISPMIGHDSIFEEIFIYEIFPLPYNYMYVDEIEKFLKKYDFKLVDLNYMHMNPRGINEKKYLKILSDEYRNSLK